MCITFRNNFLVLDFINGRQMVKISIKLRKPGLLPSSGAEKDLPGASLRTRPVTENNSSNGPTLGFSHLKKKS